MSPRRRDRIRATRTTRFVRTLVLGLALGGAAVGYGWTRSDHDPPDATWRAIEMDVDGLDCAFWCSVKVSTAVEGLPGARVDTVDTQSGVLRVRFDPTRRAIGELVKAVADKGFAVTATRPLR